MSVQVESGSKFEKPSLVLFFQIRLIIRSTSNMVQHNVEGFSHGPSNYLKSTVSLMTSCGRSAKAERSEMGLVAETWHHMAPCKTEKLRNLHGAQAEDFWAGCHGTNGGKVCGKLV